jgi:hypothetical protein
MSLEHIQKTFRLSDSEETRELIHASPIQEAFRQYLNRYLRSHRAHLEERPEDWKAVDEHIFVARITFRDPESHLQSQCRSRPYDRLPHAALFVMRVMRFLSSTEGARFDGPGVRQEQGCDRDFARCKRGLELLCSLLKQHADRVGRSEEERKAV